jgi:excisionase family DNA binding protein
MNMALILTRKSETPKVPAPTPKPLIGKEAGHPKKLELLTIKEAAVFAKVSTQTLRRTIRAGQLKVYRAGRQIRIDESDLVDYLSS